MSLKRNRISKSFLLVFLLAFFSVGTGLRAQNQVSLPLSEKSSWQVLNFSKIPANRVSFTKDGLLIDVQKSSSPLIFPLPSSPKIKSFTVKAQLLEGQLKIPKDKKQGEKGADDFLFKLGLVEKGERKLNWMQRQIAADWVLHLFKLAKDTSGVSKIRFFNLVNDQSRVGESRTHPLSDLIFEKNIAHYENKNIEINYQLSEAIDSLAFWLSLDGDDSDSSFKILVKEITYTTE